MANAAVDLVGEDEVSAYLEAAGIDTPVDLDRVISGVSAAMQSFANRSFLRAAYSTTVNGHGGNALSLPNTPISAVASVSVDGVNISAAGSAIASGFIFSDTQVLLRGYRFDRGVGNVSIAYTAGFATIPDDLRRAACEGVGAMLSKFEFGDPRVIEAKSGGTSLKFASAADFGRLCLTPDVTGVLEQYKRVTPC